MLKWRSGLALVLLVTALWQFGEASYLMAKARLAQLLLDDAWQRRFQNGDVHRPWPWADTFPVARLQFPVNQRSLVVLEGGSGRNLAFAPAHLSGSVQPGQVGVSVIGGHRDTHFAFLHQVKQGDRFLLQSYEYGVQQFEVVSIQVMDVRDSEILLEADEPMLALVACYPFDAMGSGGPLRYLVMAKHFSL